MLVGILDETHTLYGNPDQTFPILAELHTQVAADRSLLGREVRRRRSSARRDATDPSDPAYDWALYDRTVNYAAQYKIKLLFSIYGTPRWANGGATPNHAPKNSADLQKFAYAAATRYAGDFPGRGRPRPAGRAALDCVERAEPAVPALAAVQEVRGKWVIQSAIDYAKICNAVYTGVHSTLLSGEKVACGVTAPGGNNSRRASARPFRRRVPEGGEEGRAEEVRRLRPSRVSTQADGEADDEAAEERRHARQHQRL